MRSLRWALIQPDWCPWKKKLGYRCSTEGASGEGTEGTQRGLYEPAREALGEANPAVTLIVDFNPPEM